MIWKILTIWLCINGVVACVFLRHYIFKLDAWLNRKHKAREFLRREFDPDYVNEWRETSRTRPR